MNWKTVGLSAFGFVGSSALIESYMTRYVERWDYPVYEPPPTSLVLPAYNEEFWLPKTLESLQNQNVIAAFPERFEYILVDSGSTDRTVEIAESYGWRVVQAPRGKLSSRDVGIREAKGEIIVALDADCVSDDTEILTKKGWKRWEDLEVGQDVLTFNLQTEELEYQPIEGIPTYFYNGKMVHVRTRSIDALFTPRHRILLRRYWRKNKPYHYMGYEFRKAKEMVNYVNIPVAGYFNGEENGFSDDFVRLLAWVITDGHLQKHKRPYGNYEYVAISQREKYVDRIEEIRSIIEKVNAETITIGQTGKYGGKIIFENGKFIHQSRRGKRRIVKGYNESVSGKDHTFYLCSRLSTLVKRALENDIHSIPRRLLNLPNRQLQIFYETLMKGDGSRSRYLTRVGRQPRKGKPAFAQRRKDVIDAFQELCIKIGRRAVIHPHQNPSGCYSISSSPKSYVHISNKGNCKHTNYEGVVWCVTTKNGTWVGRRNGKPFITGNSFYPCNVLNMWLGHFRNPKVVAVSGSEIITDSWIWRMQSVWFSVFFLFNPRMMGRGSAFEKSAYYETGGFDLSINQFNVWEMVQEEEINFRRRLQQVGKYVYDFCAPVYTTARRLRPVSERLMEKFDQELKKTYAYQREIGRKRF